LNLYSVGLGINVFELLLQLEPINAHSFIEITIILQHTNSYMFQALLAHYQGAHNCTGLLLNVFCM